MKTTHEIFISSHQLDFEVAPYESIVDSSQGWQRYRVGTCEGLWRSTATAYEIMAVINRKPGNGHLDDVIEWFEQSCLRDRRDLYIRELMNPDFARHLEEKRGFVPKKKNLFKSHNRIRKEWKKKHIN